MFVAPKPFSVGAQASLGAGKLPGLQVQGFWDTSCLQQAFEYPAVYPGECSAGSAVIDWGGNWSDPFGHDQGKCQTYPGPEPHAARAHASNTPYV